MGSRWPRCLILYLILFGVDEISSPSYPKMYRMRMEAQRCPFSEDASSMVACTRKGNNRKGSMTADNTGARGEYKDPIEREMTC